MLVILIDFSNDIVGVQQTGRADMQLNKIAARRTVRKLLSCLSSVIAEIIVGLAVKSALAACLLGMVELSPLLHFAAVAANNSGVPAKQVRVT